MREPYSKAGAAGLRALHPGGTVRLITWDQSYMICAVIPADQSFWVRLMALDMDIWPTLTIRRSQELIVTWVRERGLHLEE